MSTAINVKSEVKRTAGEWVESVVSSFEGRVTSLSFAGSDSDGVGAGSGDVASVDSAALASFGTSASYSADG